MDKEIICVYQDCPLCGDRGKKLKRVIIDKKLNVKKVSFACEEGKELCRIAVFEKGIKTMPFFTDGERFVSKIEDLLEKPKKTTRRAKKTVKKKEVENELAE